MRDMLRQKIVDALAAYPPAFTRRAVCVDPLDADPLGSRRYPASPGFHRFPEIEEAVTQGETIDERLFNATEVLSLVPSFE